MKALIVGGAGFVGNYLMDHLLHDLKWSISITKLKHEVVEREKVSIYDLNIMDSNAVYDLLNEIKPDCIFHLAAQSSVSLSWENPGLTIDVNIKGSINLLDAVRRLNYKPRILLIGSGEEYGQIYPQEIPVKEDNVIRPLNIYAITKACQSMIGKLYADAHKMDVIIARAFNHIGPKQSPMFVVADFCKQVAEIEKGLFDPVIKVGNLNAARDFTDVRDVVRAYSLLIQTGKPGEIYNVGSGKAISINEILHKVLSLATCPISIQVDEKKIRPLDTPIVKSDITKLVTCTGWSPKIPLEQTLSDTLNYWRSTIKE